MSFELVKMILCYQLNADIVLSTNK